MGVVLRLAMMEAVVMATTMLLDYPYFWTKNYFQTKNLENIVMLKTIA
jgi:hypothetical protein